MLTIFPPILLILVSKFMIHRALSDIEYLPLVKFEAMVCDIRLEVIRCMCTKRPSHQTL